jgi:hypothetical protein
VLLSIAVTFWSFALVSGLIGRLPWDWWNDNNQEKTYQRYKLHIKTVSQKLLTQTSFMYYDNYMAKDLPIEKQITIIGSIA